MYPIDSHVPVPADAAPGSQKKYPLREMEVGQSFAAPFEDRAAVSSAMFKATIKGVRQYISRREGDKIRVWRVAPPPKDFA